MPIAVQCPECGLSKNVSDTFAGKVLKCKSCGGRIPVPAGRSSGTRSATSGNGGSRKRSGSSSSMSSNGLPGNKVAWIVGGVVVGFFALVSIIGIAIVANRVSDPRPHNNPPVLFPSTGPASSPSTSVSTSSIVDVPIPAFPPLGNPIETFADSGVELYFVDFGSMPGNGPVGGKMKMRVYLPKGPLQPASLPCVLVGPAGTNLMVGCDMDADDYHDETLPYAEAGMVTIFYSLDGGVADLESASNFEFTRAYRQFRSAHAGVVNGRNALEYALAQIPAVNPQQIYCAGHSSAGTLSLLLAAKEPRIAACAAYAPATDVEARLADVLRDPSVNVVLPGLASFLKSSSPKNFVDAYQCPVFLFHAADDSNIPIADTTAFSAQLQARGKTAKMEQVATGEHYDSMIDEGIPRAIQWFQALPKPESLATEISP